MTYTFVWSCNIRTVEYAIENNLTYPTLDSIVLQTVLKSVDILAPKYSVGTIDNQIDHDNGHKYTNFNC